MYGGSASGSGYMGIGGHPPPTNHIQKGAAISLEAFNEWKIQEIGYDGVEKYIRPETFSDHVGKLARKVNWQKLVSSDGMYDNPSLVPEESEEEEPLEDTETTKNGKKGREVPEAGPWHSVAKNLHESLQQLNVLLDNLHVMNSLEYCKPLTVLDPLSDHFPGQDISMIMQNSKANQWVWKRKALTEAYTVLETAQKLRPIDSDDGGHNKMKSKFFIELKKMREYWRVRKTGEHIYGDLGYKIFGSKYDARELFDITRRSIPLAMPDANGTGSAIRNASVLQVKVPCDLTRRSTIAITIVKGTVINEYATKNLFGSGLDSELEYMKVNRKEIDTIHWQDALKWAQETLICRDTFNQLASDAVQMKSRLCTVRDGVLLVALHDNWLLKVELKYYPFKEGEIIEEGDAYLNRSLRQMVVSQQCERWVRPQIFVDLPLTTLSESLDSRGPLAYTQDEIESRARVPRLLLDRLLSVAAHYSLVNIAVEALKTHFTNCSDPQMMWKWLRSSPTNSQIIVLMTNRNFDFVVGKVTFYIKIDEDSISVWNKEGQTIECNRDPQLLINALKFMNCTFFVSAVASLGKAWWSYQILHANMNAIDSNGNAAPTLYMCNSMSTRAILLQFHQENEPVVNVKKFCAGKEDDVPFIKLDYRSIPGSSLCRKMDNLFAIYKE